METLFGPNRLHKAEILLLLKGQRLYESQIARELGIDQPTASGHLRALERAGLVTYEKIGPVKMFKLTAKALMDVLPCLESLMR